MLRQTEKTASLFEIVLAVLRKGEFADRGESLLMVRSDFFDSVIGKGVMLRCELLKLLTYHPAFQEILLAEELIGSVLNTLGQTRLYV